ncbi:MAG: hypothetical protein IT376_00515 [Polyangiaceae bacterium]|nr:hypothetical protein [Polyangiaceae bacterium]
MSTIQWASTTPLRVEVPGAGAAAGAGAPAALALPPPVQTTGDPMAALVELESLGRSTSLRNAVRELGACRTARKDAWARARASLAKATRRRRKKGFWRKLAKTCKTVAKVATVVACVGLAATGIGAPLAIGAAVLSAAALAQSECKWMQRLGMSDETARWATVGLQVGAVACGGVGLAGASGAAGAITLLGQGAVAGGTVVQGAAHVGEGVASVEEARHERVASHHDARAVGHRLAADDLESEIDDVIERVETTEGEHQRFLERLISAHQTRNAALESAAWRV